MYELTGKTIFITGAARGLGAAMARRFHEKGARVALIGLEPEQMGNICAELGQGSMFIEVDVTDASALVDAAEQVKNTLGCIDIAVMNAGILHVGNFADPDCSGLDRTLDVNLHGVINSIRAVLPQIIGQNGYILSIASLAAIINGPLVTGYAIAKSAVDALSNSLRIELGYLGVDVGCAYFGAVDTDLVHGSRLHPAMAQMEKALPSFIGSEIGLDKAVDAIENGIRRRSSRIWAPGWVRGMYFLRGIAQPIVEWRYRRNPELAKALRAAKSDNQTNHQDKTLGAAANIGRTQLKEEH